MNNVKNWRARTKAAAIQCMGSKCCTCGLESKCNDVYDFHHIRPLEKIATISQFLANPRSWNIICEELKKCILVCANCHRLIEANVLECPTTTSFDETVARQIDDSFKKTRKYVNEVKCVNKLCGKTFIRSSGIQLYCSVSCRAVARRKVERPSREELEILLKTNSLSSIGKQFSVSHGSIKKWAKYYNIKL